MTTPFPARDAKLSGALDRAFGELFTFTAQQISASGDVNLPTVADGSKPPFTVKGVWEALTMAEYPMGRGSNPDDEAQRRSHRYPSVSVDNVLLTQWMPGRDDICVRQFDGATYQILRAMPDDMGRTLFILTNRRRPA
jgi:hypothetical protein